MQPPAKCPQVSGITLASTPSSVPSLTVKPAIRVPVDFYFEIVDSYVGLTTSRTRSQTEFAFGGPAFTLLFFHEVVVPAAFRREIGKEKTSYTDILSSRRSRKCAHAMPFNTATRTHNFFVRKHVEINTVQVGHTLRDPFPRLATIFPASLNIRHMRLPLSH